jgi:glucose/arabinose dehydrogenase
MSRPPRLTTQVITALLVVAACGDRTPTPPAAVTPSATSSATAPSSAPAPTTTEEATRFDPAAVAISLEKVVDVPGGPLGMVTTGDGNGRLYVVTQDGQVRIVEDQRLVEQPFLDISGQITTGGERGLLGVAFHPRIGDDPRVFTDYTDEQGNTVVSSWTVSADLTRADPDSESVLLRVKQPFANHNGGALQFGPDGFLYISLGDGGSGGDPQGNGQNLDTPLAKILRIDVDNTTGRTPYAIPADNPFREQAGARPETWVSGLRNPWRITFDRETGDLWIGDVGQGAFEEIDVVRASSGGGQNFGWNIMEGRHCFAPRDGCTSDGLTPPVTEYGHGGGECSVTGGYVYRGTAWPNLRGGYLFGDYCSGRMWAIDAAASEVDEPTLVLESGHTISSFGEDDAGELYVTDLGGSLLRVTAPAR